MPPAASSGSSRRKQGQPTVCLDCYLRKVKCDRKRPCSTCIRRGTEHLCKTFSTSELDPEALKKKQARRSLAEITAVAEDSSGAKFVSGPDPATSPPEHGRRDLSSPDTLFGSSSARGEGSSNPKGASSTSGSSRSPASRSSGRSTNEAPLTSFINLLLQDLSVSDEQYSPSGSSGSPSAAGASSTPPPAVHRYLEPATLDVMVGFSAVVPDLARLARLVNIYLVEVDWKFMITAQDSFEAYVGDIWHRVVVPCQEYDRAGPGSIGLEAYLQPGDLSKLAMVASFLTETIECMDPELIASLFPASVCGGAARAPIAVPIDATPRVRALTILVHHLQALIEECEKVDEMTVDLVQSNLTAFSTWSSQGRFGLSDFPRWELTIRSAREAKLFEDPERLGITDPLLLDHRRRLGWLVYGYDHSYAVGANVKPLIRESQFSVDRPSDAPPWIASGVPRDPTLAMCEVEVAKIARMLAVCITSEGTPLHRKVMEVDQQILNFIAKLGPTYALDNPDLSMDDKDPWRARRRAWLGLNLSWQRSVLHRGSFFPNGSINNGELATSRYIAIDSSLRALDRIRELKRVQNRFSDWQGSAWWYQYSTEPSITLATATLLLLRSKGRGVPGLADQAGCWQTVFHFCKILDQSIAEIDQSVSDPSLCLESFLGFGHRCSKMLFQLRSAIQSGVDALLTTTSGGMDRLGLRLDEKLAGLLNPRVRGRSPSGSTGEVAGTSKSSGSSVGALPSQASVASWMSTADRGAVPQAVAHPLRATSDPSQGRFSPVAKRQDDCASQVGRAGSGQVAMSDGILQPFGHGAGWGESGPAADGPPIARQTTEGAGQLPEADGTGTDASVEDAAQRMAFSYPSVQMQHLEAQGPPGPVHPAVWSSGPIAPPTQAQGATASYVVPSSEAMTFLPQGPVPAGGAAFLPSNEAAAGEGRDPTRWTGGGMADEGQSPGGIISSVGTGALRSYYTDRRVQRAAHENRGLSEWIARVQMGVVEPPPGGGE